MPKKAWTIGKCGDATFNVASNDLCAEFLKPDPVTVTALLTCFRKLLDFKPDAKFQSLPLPDQLDEEEEHDESESESTHTLPISVANILIFDSAVSPSAVLHAPRNSLMAEKKPEATVNHGTTSML
jgi:hypothetical protein